MMQVEYQNNETSLLCSSINRYMQDKFYLKKKKQTLSLIFVILFIFKIKERSKVKIWDTRKDKCSDIYQYTRKHQIVLLMTLMALAVWTKYRYINEKRIMAFQ